MTETTALNFGEELRRERVVREISLEEISRSTKISIRLLTALEKSDLSKLPAPTFTRGFIRAYARHLGIDPEEKVNAYLADLAGGPRDGPSPKSPRPRSRFWRGRRATAGTIVGVVAGVLVLLGLIANPQRNASRKPPARVAAPAAPVALKNVGVSSEPTPSIQQGSAPWPADPALEDKPEGKSKNQSSEKLEDKPLAGQRGQVSLVLESDDDSWTKLDADGRRVFTGVLRRGERRSFEAQRGFRLTLGNAGAVRVTVDGRVLARLGQSGEVVRDLRLPSPPARG
jgi:cytoskeletal protein RodZ